MNHHSGVEMPFTTLQENEYPVMEPNCIGKQLKFKP
jgi:hypothetical protein